MADTPTPSPTETASPAAQEVPYAPSSELDGMVPLKALVYNLPALNLGKDREARLKSFSAALSHQEDNRGLRNITVLIGNHDTEANTINGKDYIFINESSFWDALESDKSLAGLKGVLGHELSHIKNGDPHHGVIDPILKREQELRADLEGAGPLGSHNPAALAQYLENRVRREVFEYNKDIHNKAKISPTHLTQKDLKTIDSWGNAQEYNRHPSLYDRIDALKEESILMQEYEKSHKVETHAEREKESEFLVNRVMRDMKVRIDKNPDSPSPHAQAEDATKAVSLGLTPSQMEEVKAAQAFVGGPQQALSAHAPVVSHVPVVASKSSTSREV